MITKGTKSSVGYQMKNKIAVAVFAALAMVFAVNCAQGGGESSTGGGQCIDKPSGGSMVGTTSTTTGVSHNAGQDCLGTCHVSGGSAASKIFTVGGTVYNAANGTTLIKSSLNVITVDGFAMSTDVCGNFYKTSPITDLNLPKPSTVNGTMGAAVTGGCNAGGTCHIGTGGNKIW